MKKMISLLLASLLAATMLSACGTGSDSGSGSASSSSLPEASVEEVEEPSAPEGEAESIPEVSEGTGALEGLDKIAVTYVKSPLNVPSIIEREYGMFEAAFSPYGLAVEYSTLTTGPEQTQALASGDIQFLNAVGATSVILAASNGADIKIISTYSRSPEAFRLFTGDEAITTAADLAGKKVAGPKGTILHELLVAYLETAGLTEEDIEFYSMGIPESQAALVSGEVDCALLAGPTAYNMGKEGYAVVTTGEGLVDATIVTATSSGFYEAYPELVQAFLDAQHDVLDFIDGNYEEMIEVTAKETELAPEEVEEMYPMYDFSPAVTAGDIASMKKTEEFMRSNGMIENAVDVEELILTLQ